MNGRGPGIWVPRHDENGMISSMGIIVEPCANEPPETAERRAQSQTHVPWEHGIACWVFDDGAVLLCSACGSARSDEEARLARLRRLPPWAQAWIARQGLDDWPPKEG